MDRIRRFLSASTGEKVRLTIAAIQLSLLPLLLSALPFSRVRSTGIRASSLLAQYVSATPRPEELAHLVDSVDNHLPGHRTCLVRSLTVEMLLRLYGYSPDHRIGVKKTQAGALEAHSWLELEGRILIGKLENLSEYERLPSLDEGVD